MQELRIAHTLAEEEVEGGLSPRMSPLVQVRDMGTRSVHYRTPVERSWLKLVNSGACCGRNLSTSRRAIPRTLILHPEMSRVC